MTYREWEANKKLTLKLIIYEGNNRASQTAFLE